MKQDRLGVQCFGSFEITLNDTLRLVSHATSRPWALLQFLLVHRRQHVAKHEIIAALWPEGDSEQPELALKNLVYRVRKEFSCLGYTAKNIIVYTGGTYRLNNALKWELDFERFEKACKAAQRAQTEENRLAGLQTAVALYKGEFLADVQNEEWVIPHKTHYEAAFMRCAEELVPLLLARCQYAEVEALCRTALHHDPYNEECIFGFLQALIGQNKHTSALAYYENTAQMLQKSLGITPGEELQRVYRMLLPKSEKAVDIDQLYARLVASSCAVEGPLYCDYDEFCKLFRLRRAGMHLFAQPPSLLLLSLEQSSGGPLSASRLEGAMQRLMRTIQHCLEPHDVFCRYSSTQFVAMLRGASADTSYHVLEDICNGFAMQQTDGFYLDASHLPLGHWTAHVKST